MSAAAPRFCDLPERLFVAWIEEAENVPPRVADLLDEATTVMADVRKVLVDLHDALVLTSEHHPYAAVQSFVSSAAEFDRATKFLRAASGIETEGHDRAAGRGAEHESPTAAGGDAQNIAQDIGGPSQ